MGSTTRQSLYRAALAGGEIHLEKTRSDHAGPEKTKPERPSETHRGRALTAEAGPGRCGDGGEEREVRPTEPDRRADRCGAER